MGGKLGFYCVVDGVETRDLAAKLSELGGCPAAPAASYAWRNGWLGLPDEQTRPRSRRSHVIALVLTLGAS